MKIKKVIKKGLIINHKHYLLKNWKTINGPVCFKVPSWVKRPLGKYYLLFSDHEGKYLRLAYSNNIYSKWKISKLKILEIKKLSKIIHDHIASPEIYIDNKNKKICLYFHARSQKFGREQLTFVAVSKNSIDFKIKNINPIAPFYFRIFKYKNYYYGLTKGGDLFKSKNKFIKFKFIKNIFNKYEDKYHNKKGSVRHLSLLQRSEYVEIFYSKIGDSPERIYRGIMNLLIDETKWVIKFKEEILKPTKIYEGAKIFPEISKSGASKKNENAVRDPYIFCDKKDTYLFYSVKGEKGIAFAKIIYE